MNINFDLTERLFEDEPGAAGGGEVETTETTETSEEETPETPESDDEPPAPEEDLSEAEIAESKNLYKLLKDPKTKDLVLTALAQNAGLLGEAQTKQEIREAKSSISDILTDSLGKEFAFLVPKLGPAIEKILEQEREVSAQQVGRLEAVQLETQTQSVLNKLAAESKGTSRALEGKMAALAQKFPASQDISVEEYVRGLYAMASSSHQKAPAGRIAERINRNSKDVPSRLHSATGAGKDSPRNLPKMNLNQAVSHAMKSLGYSSDD